MRNSGGVLGRLALLGAGMAGAIGYVAYRRVLDAARERIRAGTVVATACGPIEYAATGEGRPVLVVHGAGGGFDQGLALGAPLLERGYRVIAMSRFGYLRTPLPADGSEQAQADAHVALLDALGLDRPYVIGVSAGAPSALQLAIRHPERVAKLALVVPGLFAPRQPSDFAGRAPPGTALLFDTALRSDFLFWAGMRLAPSTYTRALLGTLPQIVAAASPAERARVAATLESILPVSSRRLGLENDAAVVSHLRRYELERVAVPTLTVGVADDLYRTYQAAEYTAAEIPGARFVGYPSGGHLLVGRQEAFVGELAAFFDDSSRTRPK
jgi:2-hydroxy-6-oxonona-2,4-dienedioate hydrolase